MSNTTTSYAVFCERQRARFYPRAAARADFEARVVRAEERARHLLGLAAITDCERAVLALTETAKRYKRDAIRLQREGGPAHYIP